MGEISQSESVVGQSVASGVSSSTVNSELTTGSAGTEKAAGGEGSSGGMNSPPPEASGHESSAAYQPNFKYRVKDKEMEFDEWVRPVIKNKEHEEKLRDLYSRAYGLDDIKISRDSALKERDRIISTLQKANTLIDKGRFFDAAGLLGIPEKAIFKAVAEKMRFEDLSEEEKRAYNERREAELRSEQVTESYQDLRRRYEEAVLDTRQTQLQMAVSRPEIAEIARAVNESLASRGLTFEDLVMREGAVEYQISGKDLSVEEAVKRVADHYSHLMSRSFQSSGIQNPTSPQETVIRKNTPKTIPNLGRGGQAVGGARVRSIEDLKKLAKQMQE